MNGPLDENLSEKIRELLADPNALSAIASVASSLTGGSAPAEQPAAPTGAQTEPQSVPALSLPKRDPRIDLLCAIKPLVSDQKRSRLDSLVQIATVASLLGSLGKKGGNGYV